MVSLAIVNDHFLSRKSFYQVYEKKIRIRQTFRQYSSIHMTQDPFGCFTMLISSSSRTPHFTVLIYIAQVRKSKRVAGNDLLTVIRPDHFEPVRTKMFCRGFNLAFQKSRNRIQSCFDFEQNMSETVGFQQQARVHCQIPNFQILYLIRFQHQIE